MVGFQVINFYLTISKIEEIVFWENSKIVPPQQGWLPQRVGLARRSQSSLSGCANFSIQLAAPGFFGLNYFSDI